jgi:competence protein ComEC
MRKLVYFLLFAFTLALLNTPILIIPILIIFVFLYKKAPSVVLTRSRFFFSFGLVTSLLLYYLSFSKTFIFPYALVIDKRDNYLIVYTLFRKIYIPLKNARANVGDVIKLNGSYGAFHFQTYSAGFNFQTYLESKGIHQLFYLNSEIITFRNPFGFFQRTIEIPSSYSEESRVLLNAFFNHDKEYEHKLIASFDKLEVLYLLSLSGIHVNFLLRGYKKGLSYFVSEKNSLIIIIITLALFLLIFPTRFVLWRLLILNLVTLYDFKDKKYTYLDRVLISAIILLFIDPHLVNEMSFYLSYGLVIIINISMYALESRNKVLTFFFSSFIIYLLLIPIRILNTSTLSIFGFIYSLILTPLISIYYLLGCFSLLLIPIPGVINGYSHFISNISNFFIKINLKIPLGEMSSFTLLLYFVLMIFLLYSLETKHKPLKNLAILGLLSIFLVKVVPIDNYFIEAVYFLNVGQGDATLLQKGDVTVLVDTGGLTYKDVAKDVLIPFFYKHKITKLNAVILTHEDFDHQGALPSLLRNFKVDQVIDNEVYFPLNIKNLTIHQLNKVSEYEEENEKSLVLYTRLCNLNFLLMGDATINNEADILSHYPNLDVDILKLGHHGSNTSSSYQFLKEINPQTAIISCGYKNKYRHPSYDVIERLQKLNIKIRRTDLDGPIYYKSFVI